MMETTIQKKHLLVIEETDSNPIMSICEYISDSPFSYQSAELFNEKLCRWVRPWKMFKKGTFLLCVNLKDDEEYLIVEKFRSKVSAKLVFDSMNKSLALGIMKIDYKP